MLTKAALRCLREMIEAEDDERYDEAELVCEGRTCWLGIRRLHWNTVNQLVEVIAIRDTSDDATVRRFMVNGVGRAIDADPSLARQVWAAVSQGRKFTVADGQLEFMSEDGVKP